MKINNKKKVDNKRKNIVKSEKKVDLKRIIKEFFSNKRNVIILSIVLVVVLISIFLLIILLKDGDGDSDEKLSLSTIYDVYPEEVRNLYANMINVSCSGDLHLDITLDAGVVSVRKMKDKNLLDYIFSYLEKNEKLADSFSIQVLEEAVNELLNENIDFSSKIKDYEYGGYVYDINNNVITRKFKECKSDKYYVSHLYGYSFNEKLLSVDINIGYLDDDILYDLADNKLGKYDGKIEKLGDLFGKNSYYRFNFVKVKDVYKLDSVEWNSRV